MLSSVFKCQNLTGEQHASNSNKGTEFLKGKFTLGGVKNRSQLTTNEQKQKDGMRSWLRHMPRARSWIFQAMPLIGVCWLYSGLPPCIPLKFVFVLHIIGP